MNTKGEDEVPPHSGVVVSNLTYVYPDSGLRHNTTHLVASALGRTKRAIKLS